MKGNLLIRIRLGLILAGVVAALAATAVILSKCEGTGIEVEKSHHVEVTPATIASIKAIGQWEFLTVNDEEYVDTVRKRFLGDDGLARIYYGTLRLGVDMSQMGEHSLRMEGDTLLVATVPRVGLLDKNFIDEARTRSFYEKGKWDAGAREDLYERAHRMMLGRCVTPTNLRRAEDNARRELTRLFNTMGYEHVRILFEEANN